MSAQSTHWSNFKQIKYFQSNESIQIFGGSDYGKFCLLSPNDDILLSINDDVVAGYTLFDCQNLIKALTSKDPPDKIKLEVVTKGLHLPPDLRSFLSIRTLSNSQDANQCDSMDVNLQSQIRDNLYKRTVPCTTRKPKDEEIDGVDYQFLSVDEFLQLERTGMLLESGVFEDSYYGTPRPPHESETETLLPGWEEVVDDHYGVYYINHILKTTQYEKPVAASNKSGPKSILKTSPPEENGGISSSTNFTKDVSKLKGTPVNLSLMKGPAGLGFTIVGADTRDDEFLQVKTIFEGRPAAIEGSLRTGDVLVKVNGIITLGFSHSDIVSLFQSIPVHSKVDIEAIRGYPLPFDPNDPNIHYQNTLALPSTAPALSNIPAPIYVEVDLAKGMEGFGFTVADSPLGQRVKQILTNTAASQLLVSGDLLVELNGRGVRRVSHEMVVEMLRLIPIGQTCRLLLQRGLPSDEQLFARIGYSPRSKTPGYFDDSAQSLLPAAPPRPRSANFLDQLNPKDNTFHPSSLMGRSWHPSMAQEVEGDVEDGFHRDNVDDDESGDEFSVFLRRDVTGFGFRLVGGSEEKSRIRIGFVTPGGPADRSACLRMDDTIVSVDGISLVNGSHRQAVSLMATAAQNGQVTLGIRRSGQLPPLPPSSSKPDGSSYLRPPSASNNNLAMGSVSPRPASSDISSIGSISTVRVRLERSVTQGFGFVVVSSVTPLATSRHTNGVGNSSSTGENNGHQQNNGTEDNCSRSSSLIGESLIGHVLPDSPAFRAGIKVGQRLMAINDRDVTALSHGQVIGLIKEAGTCVCLTLKTTSNVGGGGGNLLSPSALAHSPKNGGGDDVGDDVDTIELFRGARGGFGFSIRGGSDFGLPLFVLRIASDGSAALDGRLQIDDRIVKINDCAVEDLRTRECLVTHANAIGLIETGPSVLRLGIVRDGK